MSAASFSAGACHCVDVDLGSYDNVVQMKCPTVTRHDGWVSIDTCIATEIGWLWHQGVTTLNSCCGHGQFDAWVVVDRASDELMVALGYEYALVPSGVRCYALRTGTRLVDPTPSAVPGVPMEAARLGRQLTRAEILLDKDGSKRIWHQAVWDGDCLRWIGRITPYGYGQLGVNYEKIHAHRLAYELAIGPIPDGYHVDHVAARGCRFRDCINPAHLEAVTPGENVRRTYPRTKPAKRPTHCRRGHDYATHGFVKPDGSWRCQACQKIWRDATKGSRVPCPGCGKEMLESSLAEHSRDRCKATRATTAEEVGGDEAIR